MKWVGCVERMDEVGGVCGENGLSGWGMWREWMKWVGCVERMDEVGGVCGENG